MIEESSTKQLQSDWDLVRTENCPIPIPIWFDSSAYEGFHVSWEFDSCKKIHELVASTVICFRTISSQDYSIDDKSAGCGSHFCNFMVLGFYFRMVI
jgi:hypothetical protein